MTPLRGWQAVAIALLLWLGLAPGSAVAAPCDRACLQGMVTRYIDAVVAHDPSTLPLAENVRFTEDTRVLPIGEGHWKTITGRGTFRQDYLDTARQVAAAHVELREGANPVLYSLALHLQDGKIAGIETIVERITPESRFQPTELGGPIRGMNDPVPQGRRQSRAEMIATALAYTKGLRIGNFTDAGTPFADGTYRVENGVITAGEGCRLGDCGMYTQRIMLHPAIIPSVVAVDEENGTVLLWMNFGDTGSYGENTALVTFEGFKVWGGQIHAINAFFGFLPASSPRAWNSAELIPSVW